MRPNEAAHESGQAPSCVTSLFLPLAGCSRVSGRLPRLKPAPPARPNQEVKNMSYIEASPKGTSPSPFAINSGLDVHDRSVSVVRRAVEAMLWHRPSSWASHALLVLSLVLSAIPVSLSIGSATLLADPPRKSNGLTDVVQWDNYSLFVNDQRIFLQCVYPLYPITTRAMNCL